MMAHAAPARPISRSLLTDLEAGFRLCRQRGWEQLSDGQRQCAFSYVENARSARAANQAAWAAFAEGMAASQPARLRTTCQTIGTTTFCN
jgi:hypothetical protein